MEGMANGHRLDRCAVHSSSSFVCYFVPLRDMVDVVVVDSYEVANHRCLSYGCGSRTTIPLAVCGVVVGPGCGEERSPHKEKTTDLEAIPTDLPRA